MTASRLHPAASGSEETALTSVLWFPYFPWVLLSSILSIFACVLRFAFSAWVMFETPLHSCMQLTLLPAVWYPTSKHTATLPLLLWMCNLCFWPLRTSADVLVRWWDTGFPSRSDELEIGWVCDLKWQYPRCSPKLHQLPLLEAAVAVFTAQHTRLVLALFPFCQVGINLTGFDLRFPDY